jgi:hypothetical protein
MRRTGRRDGEEMERRKLEREESEWKCIAG